MRVVVTGAAGQLGSALADGLGPAHEVVPLTRRELDLTDKDAVGAALRDLSPGAVVNAAGFNDVDGAEERPLDALLGNAVAVDSLAEAAVRCGTLLVHFSSDFVFGDGSGAAWREEDRPRPLGSYGASKLRGERLAARVPRHLVLRVESLFGGRIRKSSIDRMAAALLEGRPVRAFSDRTLTPSPVPALVELVGFLLTSTPAPGLYHAVCSEPTTWLELAGELERLLGRDGLVSPALLAEASLRAPRPRHAALDNDKLRRAGFPMPTWREALAEYAATLRAEPGA